MLPLLIAGGAAIAGGIGNYLANMSAADRAAALQDKDMQDWLNIHIPDPETQKLALQRFVVQGQLTPEMEHAIKQDPSAFEKIQVSQENKSAQNRALQQLEKLGYEGGLRLQDKAALQDAMMQSQVADRGNRMAIQDDMARRGMGDSGFALQAQLAGQQATGDRQARSSLQVASDAQDRALKSIMGAGDLASKYRTQDWDEQAQRAQAADAINRFNTGNMQDVQQRNIAMQNRASEMNLAQKQKTSDQNTQLSNDEQKYNKGLIQQQYENEINRQKGISGVRSGQEDLALKRGQAEGNLYSNMGQGVAGAAGAYQNGEFWDNYFKKRNGA